MKDTLEMNMNKVVQFLGKPVEEFTKQDIIKFIEGKNIKMVNFRYVGGDGRLKTLNFVIASKAQLDRLLSMGKGWTAQACCLILMPLQATCMLFPGIKPPM